MNNNREDHDRGIESQRQSKKSTNSKKILRDIRDMINESMNDEYIDYERMMEDE